MKTKKRVPSVMFFFFSFYFYYYVCFALVSFFALTKCSKNQSGSTDNIVDSNKNDSSKCITLFRDRDRDGYSDGVKISHCGGEFPEGFTDRIKGEGDCNDYEPSVTSPNVFFKDFDKDGFTDGITYISCGPAVGYVKEGKAGDCDDNDPNINPLAQEICDGKDNNCNGEVDEGLLLTFYEDKDKDGFGNPKSFVKACTKPEGYVDNSLDCDDSFYEVSPTGIETCNGIDDNCNGAIDEGIDCSAKYISAGGNASCFIAGDSSLLCWGFNLLGAVGNKKDTDAVFPEKITQGIKKVYADSTAVCATDDNDTLLCWGSAFWLTQTEICASFENITNCSRSPEKIYDGVKSVAIVSEKDVFSALVSEKDVFSAPKMLCIVDTNGNAKCKGDFGDRSFPDFTFILDGVSEISAGESHVCFLKSSGVFCWGDNSSGQIGDGTLLDSYSAPKKVAIEEGINIKDICSGSKHNCAISDQGAVYCWGDNFFYQISSTLPTSVTIPTFIGYADKARCGPEATCLIKNQKLTCRGLSVNSNLSNVEANFRVEEGITLKDDVVDVSLSLIHTCAINSSGGVECRGGNFGGNLGVGEKGNSEIPILIRFSGIRKVNLGAYTTCALTERGDGICFGLGISQSPKTISTQNTLDIKANSSENGGTSICFLKEGGDLICSGYIYPLGYIESMKIDSDVSQFDLSEKNLCFTKQNELYCMGDNYWGQIGDGTRETRITPIRIMTDVISFSVGNKNVCAIRRDGSLWCWGDNSKNQVKSSTTQKIFVIPEKVDNDIIFVSVGDETICRINKAMKMICTGLLGYQEIYGTYHVSVGSHHACAITGDNALWCWGANNFGEVGRGKRGEYIRYPTKIIENIIFVDVGKYHTCAVNSSGGLLCWGMNLFGEIGNSKSFYPYWRRTWR